MNHPDVAAQFVSMFCLPSALRAIDFRMLTIAAVCLLNVGSNAIKFPSGSFFVAVLNYLAGTVARLGVERRRAYVAMLHSLGASCSFRSFAALLEMSMHSAPRNNSLGKIQKRYG